MNKDSQTIKTAFIISIIGGAFSDVVILYYFLTSSIVHIDFLPSNLITMLIVVGPICVAPLVLGTVADNIVKKATPQCPRDRVFKTLAKIFSMVAIVEGAILLTYYVFLLLFSNFLYAILS